MSSKKFPNGPGKLLGVSRNGPQVYVSQQSRKGKNALGPLLGPTFSRPSVDKMAGKTPWQLAHLGKGKINWLTTIRALFK